jgi:hypothetical protein
MTVAGLNGWSWYKYWFADGYGSKYMLVCAVCVCFYLRCIIIPKHFHWLATNFASIPMCIEGCFHEVLLLFLHCNVNFIDFRRLVVDFRAVF